MNDCRTIRQTAKWIWLVVSVCGFAVSCEAFAAESPDIILMMADDLGFSDVGCYGSEIPTPNLDSLAEAGQRFTSFSNTSRCCPSRASLMTGQYSHQAGIGDMNYRDSGPGYRGQLLADVPTLPELLKQQGYSTCMIGKWHLTRSQTINGGPNGSWPFQRGFDRFYGSMEGAKNYFGPTWFYDNSSEVEAFDDSFFYTNAISERAATWIAEQPNDTPLFLYAAFYAPHFPLQAPADRIARHRGNYLAGWDELRQQRLTRQKGLGIVPSDTQLSPRPDDVPAWSKLSEKQKDELDLRMATYAAQVELLDEGVGRLLKALRDNGRMENSLIIFLSDNGAASSGGVFGAGPIDKVGTPQAPVKTTYGKGWATLSNTPYRMHKANTHEGGVMAPLIIHRPERDFTERSICTDVAHIIDVAPTALAATGADLSDFQFEGIDLLSDKRGPSDAVFYEHEKSRAVRQGDWKLVNRGKSKDWELYNLSKDRTELNNLAEQQPDRVESMNQLWLTWAKRCNVKTSQ